MWQGVFLILWIIFAHWVGDFVCQTHWQASNKSKNWNALARHVVTYTLCMTILIAPAIPGWHLLPTQGAGNRLAVFFAVTLVAHFVTDAITSRITSRLYAKQDWHNFFVVVGFDQVLHYAQLFATFAFIVGDSWPQ